jgi:Flp pilus assembly protein TadD
MANGDQQGARTAVARARNLNPNSPQLIVLEIALFTRDGDFVRAESLLETLKSGGFDPVLRLTLAGELREAQLNYPAAAAAYREAFAQQPSLVLAMRTSRALQAAGEENPTEIIEEWVKLTPDDTFALKSLASWHIDQGQFDQAQVYLERVIEIREDDPFALNDLAWVYQQIDDKRALATAQRAYGLRPSDPAIADTLGWVQVQLGNSKIGLDLLQKALTSAPDNPEIQYHLAIAYRDSGDTSSAKEILNVLIESDQKFPSRTEAEKAWKAL